MARVMSNFNTPPFKKFTLATVTVTRLASSGVHSVLLCANHREQGKYTKQDMQAAQQSKNQDTCSLSARKGAMWTRRFVPLAAVNPEAIHVRCCAENEADAVAKRLSIRPPILPSQQTK